MPQEKSPFRGFTIAEIRSAEAVSYVIQVGVDAFSYKGQMCFGQRSAVILYNKILANLVDLIKNGSQSQKEEALKCLLTLKIMPLRIH